jgi:hypothetical protein
MKTTKIYIYNEKRLKKIIDLSKNFKIRKRRSNTKGDTRIKTRSNIRIRMAKVLLK